MYSKVQCSVMQCSTVWCCAVVYSTVKWFGILWPCIDYNCIVMHCIVWSVGCRASAAIMFLIPRSYRALSQLYPGISLNYTGLYSYMMGPSEHFCTLVDYAVLDFILLQFYYFSIFFFTIFCTLLSTTLKNFDQDPFFFTFSFNLFAYTKEK